MERIPFKEPVPDWAEDAYPQGHFLALPPWALEVEFPGFLLSLAVLGCGAKARSVWSDMHRTGIL